MGVFQINQKLKILLILNYLIHLSAKFIQNLYEISRHKCDGTKFEILAKRKLLQQKHRQTYLA